MCPPEMCPIAYTAPTMTSMNANEIMPSWAMEKATLVPEAITPVAAADRPLRTRGTRFRGPRREASGELWVELPLVVARGVRPGVSPPSARGDYMKPVRHGRTLFHAT